MSSKCHKAVRGDLDPGDVPKKFHCQERFAAVRTPPRAKPQRHQGSGLRVPKRDLGSEV